MSYDMTQVTRLGSAYPLGYNAYCFWEYVWALQITPIKAPPGKMAARDFG
jgi:hypothetical protein